jgi:hypothetical protein
MSRTTHSHAFCRSVLTTACFCLITLLAPIVRADAPVEKAIDGPDGVRVSVKMIGPVTQTTDLQIICVLKHDPSGDKYIEAMRDFNDKLGGLLSSLRERGEFIGEPGETLLFTPPADSIPAKQVLMIGVGEESALTLDRLRLVGRIAAREAVRLKATHVSFAPGLRDQGSIRIDVGEGDAAFVEQFLLAYDTETRLQTQGIAPKAAIADLTIEAGPKYFGGAVEKVTAAIVSTTEQLKQRAGAPYRVRTAAK